MKLRTPDIILLVVGAVVVITVVFTAWDRQDLSPSQPPTSLQGASSADPMAGHHSASSADSAVFSGLAGKEAPDFTLEGYDGDKLTISSLKGKNVVLFFNEGLMCYPACWNQIAAFGKDTEFKDKNTVVLNITVDPKADWKDAVDKMPELAAATVLFDTDRKVSRVYGVLTLPSSMHKGQFPGHSYVLIDKTGVVRFTKDDEQMGIRDKDQIAEIEKLQ